MGFQCAQVMAPSDLVMRKGPTCVMLFGELNTWDVTVDSAGLLISAHLSPEALVGPSEAQGALGACYDEGRRLAAVPLGTS